MSKKILVTGGAGFIGSHIVDELIRLGHQVRVFDSLTEQVHGLNAKKPDYLNPAAEFIQGDVRDRSAVLKAIDDIEIIFHKAAAVGVGQSMYQIRHYMDMNTIGGATILDVLANENNKIEKLIVASSMSIYGEGKYNCSNCGILYPRLRPEKQLAQCFWEVRCLKCDIELEPQPTDELKTLMPMSIYAIGKRDHEEMFLSFGFAYNIPTVALRYFNVYGPRQALSNPYTGVAAIFSSRILNNNPPVIYEDGRQTRDFIHISDIVQANILAMEKKEADFEIFNIGSGIPQEIGYIAEILIEQLNKKNQIKPEIVRKFRKGDIRHCYADIRKIKAKLGFEPKIEFQYGIKELTRWVAQQSAQDKFEKAKIELELHGLTT